MPNELYNLFLAILPYLESNDYKSANNLALELFDVDTSLIADSGFTQEQINHITTKLLLFSIEKNPDITNLSAFQYVCFYMDDGISKIINLDNSFYYNTNSIGVMNNLALAYFISGNSKKALEIQKIAVSNMDNDFLMYDNQRDLIYFNEMIYEISCNGTVNFGNKNKIINILSSQYVYDFEYTLLVSMIFNDYEYFCAHYKNFCSEIDFDNEIKILFNEYYRKQICPSAKDFLKYLNPMAIYDELLYKMGTK